MAFPLDIRTDLNLGGTWTDISGDVYLRDAKRITRGLRDQGSAADPSSLTLTLNNKGGKYSPRNAMSPLYGLIGRNTPVRVSVPGSESYLQIDGRTTNFASTPDSAVLDVTGDLDVRIEADLAWHSAANQLLLGKWTEAGNQRSWCVQVGNSELFFRYSLDGTLDTGWFHLVPLPAAMPSRAAVRVTFDADNGSNGRTVTFYWSTSLAGPWTLLAAVPAAAGPATLFNSTAPLTAGPFDFRGGTGIPRYPFDGRLYRAEVRSGIDGTVIAAPDFRSLAEGTRSFTDSAGLPWTLSGNAEVRNREDRFVGEVSSWPLKWSTDDADLWTPVTASGPMRRMGQGTKALDSALRRRIPSGKPIAYWPLEEAQDATRAYSPIDGVFPASVSSVEWASWDTLPSSAPLPRLTQTSSLSAPVPAATPGQWQVEFVYNADDKVPTSDAQVISFTAPNGYIKRWVITFRQGITTVNGYTSTSITTASKVISQPISVGADVFHGWTRLRFYAIDDTDGSGFTWRISWQDVGGDAGIFSGSQPSGTCGSLSLVSADWPASLEGWGIGHVAVLREAGSTLFDGSDNAYLGESAWVRMRRLATEESFSMTRQDGRLDPELVGFQRRDTLLNLLEAAAEADGGLLTEDMRRIGLHYRDRSSLYAQSPALTLSYTAPGLGPDLEPVDDDSDIVNDVTVSRDAGSSARSVLESGPLSVLPAPDGIGKYDAAYTLSLANDDQPGNHAAWRLHLGTFDGARYPTVSLMLHKPGAESLIPAVLALREGDVIRLTNLPEWVSHDDVDLIVLGWTETLDLYRWDVTLNCVPAGPWNTAVTDRPTFGKADTDGSELGLSVSATDTTLSVVTTAGPLWVTDPAFMPFDIRLGGEVCTVSSVTGAVADTFSRAVSNGWGVLTSGQTWVNSGGTLSDFWTVGA